MANVNIENIGLYLSSKYGNRSDYKLVLHIYSTAAITANGLPEIEAEPLGVSERTVSDVDHEGWYIFDFSPPVIVETGIGKHYSLVLFLKPDDILDQPDFTINYVDWFHSKSKTTKTSDSGNVLHSFSSDIRFGSESDSSLSFDYGYTSGRSIFSDGYGYAISGNIPGSYDYFDVIGFDGLQVGRNSVGLAGSYSFNKGWEMGNFVSSENIQRNYKIYGNFNDIQFISSIGDEVEEQEFVQVNLPAATEIETIIDNRQDFVKATKIGSKVVGNYLTLDQSGERLYSTNISDYDRGDGQILSTNVEWFESNLFLSSNDLNYLDIANPSGNTNAFKAVLVSCPYFSGVYYSSNGGSTWSNKTLDLLYDGDFRNISVVAFDPDLDYILAIDKTTTDEYSKVYVLDGIDSATSWTYQGKVGTGVEVTCIISLGSDEFWIGTTNGVYKTLDKGVSWSSVSTGLDASTEVRDIQEQTTGSGVLIIATSTGTYAFDPSGVTNPTESWTKLDSSSSYSAHINGNYCYIGTSTNLLRNIDADLSAIFTTGLTFEGSNVGDSSFYPFGIIKQRVSGITSNSDNESEIYVSQFGGILFSENDGGNFVNISNKLSEKRIKKLVKNPVSSRVLYALTETSKFSRAGTTIILDTSGSMFANDPEGRRIDFLKAVVDGIYNQAVLDGETSYFQLITYGIFEEEAKRSINIIEQGKDFPGVTNETGGYTSNADFVKNKLENFRTIGYHFQSPIAEALEVSSEGLENYASSWSYDERDKVYEFNKIVSQYFNELDRSVILVTDGFNSVLNQSLDNAISSGTSFSRMRGNFYVVGIGHDIDYENLVKIRYYHKFGYLYTSPYKENIYNQESDSSFKDLSEIILDKEKFRKRTGTWSKRVSFTEKRKMTSVEFSASSPSGTTVSLKVRASSDKNNWSSWSGPFVANVSNALDLSGKYFEFYITLESNSTRYSPEIKSLTYTTLDPKDSILLYNSQTLQNSNKIEEIIITTLDDNTLGRISTDDVNSQYGVLQSSSTNFDFYKNIERDKRSVVNRKDYENLVTKDGYFFRTERGSWPSDADFDVYDITEGIINVENVINSNLYYSIPEKGLVIFYNKVVSGKKYAIRINFDDSVYRVGMKFTNYSSSVQNFRLHDIGWTFLDDQDTFLKNREALPYVGSQLGEGEIYGFASPQYPTVSELTANVISLQYISRTNYLGGTVSVTNGNKLDISTTSDTLDRYYDQNFGLSTLQVTDPLTTGYVTVSSSKVSSVPLVESTDSLSFKQQINIPVSSLSEGESLAVILGDTSSGGDGLPSVIYMNNLLFEITDPIEAEYKTTFLFATTSTTESASVEDSPITFNKALSPELEFSANSTVSLLIIAPTTVTPGTSFEFVVLAIDGNGFINRMATDSVSLQLSNTSAGVLTTTAYTFTLNDSGRKKFNCFVNSSTIDYFTINTILNGVIYESNPIVTDFDQKIRWGDLNVSTVFSEGRQDIDFIVDYAKNTSLIEFVGIADDISKIDQNEFDYIRYKGTAESSGTFVCLPGFRYRVSNSHGERVILFSNAFEPDDTVPIFTNPFEISGEDNQIRYLSERLEGDSENWNYISFPIHTPYTIDSSRPEVYDRRSFNYENYRFILQYGQNSLETINISNFVDNESVVEIYSDHGNTEYNSPPDEFNTYGNTNFFSNSISHYTRYALRIGKRFGFVANSGNYSSRPGYSSGEESKYISNRPSGLSHKKGLTAIRLDNLSSEGVIQSLKDRNCYATTGARIYLNFYAQTIKNGVTITLKSGEVIYDLEKTGSRNELALYPNTFYIRAIGDKSNITRILVYKIKVDENITELFLDSANTTVTDFNKTNFGRDTGLLELIDTDIQTQDVLNKEYVYYIKVIQQDGQFAWASPIYFNYGRTDGIRSLESITGNFVFGPSLIGSPETISSIPAVYNGAPGFFSFPQFHKETLINTTTLIPQLSTRQTAYGGRYLYVGNKICSFTGMRMLLEDDYIVSYGTHNPQFVLFSNEISEDIDVNFNNINQTSENIIYSVLNSDEITRSRDKYYRDYLFGTVWQYVTGSGEDFTSDFSLDGNGINIFSSPEIIKIAKDPYLFLDSDGIYRMAFSTAISAYPESSFAKLDRTTYPVTGSETNYDELEEFAGFAQNANNDIQKHSRGLIYRISYTDDSGSTARTFSSLAYRMPNNFMEETQDSQKISYSSSPNIIQVDLEYKYHLYFLGWMLNDNNVLVFGMFVRKFNNFSELQQEGPIEICFLFTSSSDGVPSRYDYRITDFNSFNFIPKDLRSNGIVHPIYAFPWQWLTVVKQENGAYYAFVNYLNRLGSSEYLGNDSPGTAILYSFDGINFNEKNRQDNSTIIPNISNKLFVHPFKYFGGWYMTYREVLNTDNIGEGIRNWPLNTIKFNWISQFEDNN